MTKPIAPIAVEILFCLVFGSFYLEWSAKKIAISSKDEAGLGF
ncbi:hypothetical protein [Epilithonimonas sp. UC225_85]